MSYLVLNFLNKTFGDENANLGKIYGKNWNFEHPQPLLSDICNCVGIVSEICHVTQKIATSVSRSFFNPRWCWFVA